MKRTIPIICLLFLFVASGLAPDSLKKVFISVYGGALRQFKVMDDNDGSYNSFCVGTAVGFKTKKHLLLQPGLEYYQVYFLTGSLNSGSGYDETNNVVTYNKFCIPLYINYISHRNNVVIGAGPVAEGVTIIERTYKQWKFDDSNYQWKTTDHRDVNRSYNPIPLSVAAQASYWFKLGHTKLQLGLRFKYGLVSDQYTTNKGNTNVRFRDVNAVLNAGLVF